MATQDSSDHDTSDTLYTCDADNCRRVKHKFTECCEKSLCRQHWRDEAYRARGCKACLLDEDSAGFAWICCDCRQMYGFAECVHCGDMFCDAHREAFASTHQLDPRSNILPCSCLMKRQTCVMANVDWELERPIVVISGGQSKRIRARIARQQAKL